MEQIESEVSWIPETQINNHNQYPGLYQVLNEQVPVPVPVPVVQVTVQVPVLSMDVKS